MTEVCLKSKDMTPAQLETKEEAEQVNSSRLAKLVICFKVSWHLSRVRPRQSSRKLEWWLGLTDAEKDGEFSWTLGNHNETLWGNVMVEDGSSHPRCATMDANQTLRGVDCTVGKTDTATRTILCETGGKVQDWAMPNGHLKIKYIAYLIFRPLLRG